MSLNAQDLIGPIVTAIKPVLSKYWKDVKDYAQTEADKMAKTLESVAQLRLTNQIDDQQALALVEMQKHSMQAVLLAVEGIGLIAAQNAVNAAVGAVKGAVNGAIGVALL